MVPRGARLDAIEEYMLSTWRVRETHQEASHPSHKNIGSPPTININILQERSH